MGRLRSFFRRAAKPAVMAFVAAGVALSLVVTTPSNAQAFVPPVPLPVVFGATQMATPALMATATILGPVGWTIVGVGALGVGLYATRDYWLPYVTGAFGGPDNDVDAGNTQYKIAAGYRIQDVSAGTGANSHKIYWKLTFVSSWTTKTVKTLFDSIQCRNNTTSVLTTPLGVVETQTYEKLDTGIVRNVAPCPAGTTVTGAKVGPSALPTDQPPGPENIIYYGAASQAGFDPRGADVQYKNTVECVKPDGTFFDAEAISIGTDGALKYPSCDALWPGAHATGKAAVTGLAPGSTVPETIWSSTAPAPSPQQPLCGPTIPGTGCKLGVKVDQLECVVGLWECEHWTDLRNDPNQAPRVSCQYGPYPMPIEACNPLERAYEPDGAPASEQNLDGNTATRSDTMPNGQPQPKESTLTPTLPGTVPGASGSPEAGADPKSSQCWPTGWGMLNPLEWILKPIRCAFEPTKNFSAEGGALRDKAMSKAPLSFVAAIGATAPVSVGGQGVCPAWVVNITHDTPGQNGSYSKNVVCDSSFIQAIVNARPVLFGLISGSMLWPFLRSLWYAIIPVVRVVPTGGR